MGEISGTPRKFNYTPNPLGGTEPDPKKPGSGNANGVGSGSGDYGYNVTGGSVGEQPEGGMEAGTGPTKAPPQTPRAVGIANFPNMMRTGDKAAGKQG